MEQRNNLRKQPVDTASLNKRILLGAGIAFILITVFLVTGGEGKPDWGRFWMIRPLIVVPFAGAVGGACYYFIDHVLSRGGWRRILAHILSLIIYIFGLWMGTVLGLAGTYWN